MPPKPSQGKSSAADGKLPTIANKASPSKAPSAAAAATPGTSPAKGGSGATASKGDGKDASKLPKLEVKSSPRITNDAGAVEQSQPEKAAAEAAAAAIAAAVEAKKKEESDRIAAETAAIEAEEAEKARKKVAGNGMVTLIYQNYNEQFPIIDGSTTHANIDEVYCLSFVMPECKIHLSTLTPKEKLESEENKIFDVYMDECPIGTYMDLEKEQTYYVYIEEKNDPNQALRDAEKIKKVAAKANSQVYKRNDGRAMEGCSCIYGNPCMDEYGCRDWGNRFAISTANGWKGF